jgi:hypothetical protein
MLATPHAQSVCPGATAPVSLAPTPVRLTTTAWSPQEYLSVADWVRQGRWLGALGRGSGWWIGDWIRYGNARYGERYGPAAQLTGYDEHSLRNMAYVAGRFEGPRRRESLSFSHHAELAGLSTEEQDLWLDRTEAGELSVRSLRSELRQARRRAESRLALAEARRNRDGGGTSIPLRDTAFGGDVDAPSFADAPMPSLRTAAGAAHANGTSKVRASAASDVVCPECGCHFDPTVDRRTAHARDLGND